MIESSREKVCILTSSACFTDFSYSVDSDIEVDEGELHNSFGLGSGSSVDGSVGLDQNLGSDNG